MQTEGLQVLVLHQAHFSLGSFQCGDWQDCRLINSVGRAPDFQAGCTASLVYFNGDEVSR